MIYDAFMCPDFLAVANGFVSNEIPCVGVSSTARITSPYNFTWPTSKFEFFALLSSGMFLKANKVTWVLLWASSR